MKPFLEFVNAELENLSIREKLRQPRTFEGPSGPVVRVEKRELLNFSSNNYLGLTGDARVREGAHRAIDRYGVGSGASRLISGTLGIHRELEEALAQFEARRAALVFTSGYQANIGLVTALAGPGDAVFSDRLNHASIIDACRLSRAKFFVYPHRDTAALEKQLKRAVHFRHRFIVTDGVFSMDGDFAPLDEIAKLARQYQADWIVDEAHGTGVVGTHGRGVHELSKRGSECIVMGTLSKALGSLGGFISGEEKLIRYIVNRARSFIYTTALAPASAGGALAALKIVRDEPWRRIRLESVAVKVRRELAKLGWELRGAGKSPIIPVISGSVQRTMRLARYCFEKGLFIAGIRPPTVPEGEGRLRITVMSEHSDVQIDQLIEVFGNALREVPSEDPKISAQHTA